MLSSVAPNASEMWDDMKGLYQKLGVRLPKNEPHTRKEVVEISIFEFYFAKQRIISFFFNGHFHSYVFNFFP